MNYFLIVIICIYTECSTAWIEEPFTSYAECEQYAKELKVDLMNQFPNSSGEITCSNQEEFVYWKDLIEQGMIPQLNPNHKPFIQEQSI
jgi:hypothetical protein